MYCISPSCSSHQQSTERHINPLALIVLPLNQSTFAFTHGQCIVCVAEQQHYRSDGIWLDWSESTIRRFETSMLTKHNMKRVYRYVHSWLDNIYNAKFVASVRGFSVLRSIWNIQICILYLSDPTYLYLFLNIGANVVMIVEYRLIECLLLNANSAMFQLYHGENK